MAPSSRPDRSSSESVDPQHADAELLIGMERVENASRDDAPSEAAQDHIAAVKHLLAMRRYKEAADLLGSEYEMIISTGEYAEVDNLLKQFPNDISQHHPWLLLARARIQGSRRDTHKTEPMYKEAESRSRNAEDQQAIFACLREFGSWLSSQNRFTEAVVTLRKALVFASTDGDRASVLANLALSLYMESGLSSEVEKLVLQAQDFAKESDSAFSVGQVRLVMAELNYMRGNFENALVLYSTVEWLSDRHYSRSDQARILNSAAYIHALSGNFERAEQLLESSIQRLVEQQNQEALTKADALLLRGILALGGKQYSVVNNLLHQALALYQEDAARLKVALTLDWLSNLACREDRWEDAVRYAESGLEQRRTLGLSYEIGLSYISLGRALLGEGQHDRARSYLHRGLEIAYTGDARYRQAEAHLLLAALALQSTTEPAQRFSLQYHAQQALSLARRNGYGYLFRGGVLPVQVLVEALSEDIEAEYASSLLSKAALTNDPKVLNLLNALASNRNPSVKRARATAIKAWRDAPAEPIYIRTLGMFVVTRWDGTVASWPRSSSKTVLQYLLLHRSRAVPIEELVEVLWPESDLSPARKNLHQAVAGLRHALEPDIPAGFPSRYIQSEFEAYRLVLPKGSAVDNVFFSEQCSHLDTLAELERAASLYTGDFLADNPYADWAMSRRAQFSERYREVLLRLIDLYFNSERLSDCLASAQRLQEHDPWNEDAVLWLMRAYAVRGDRASALRAYKSLQKRLLEDFDIAPRHEIQQLHSELVSL